MHKECIYQNRVSTIFPIKKIKKWHSVQRAKISNYSYVTVSPTGCGSRVVLFNKLYEPPQNV